VIAADADLSCTMDIFCGDIVISSKDVNELADHRFLFSISKLPTAACSLMDDATVDDRAREYKESRLDAADENVEDDKLLVMLLSNMLFSCCSCRLAASL